MVSSDGGMRLTRRRAVVTGAGQGVGAAIARRLAAEGAAVALVDRDGTTVARVAAEIAAAGGTVTAVRADVTDRDELERELGHVRAEIGELDVIVNNAGRWTVAPFAESDPKMWREDIETNLFGTLHVVHLLIGSLIEHGDGRIVNVISDSSRTGEPNVAVYAAAKAAVGGFTRALAKEVGPHGVTVNCISLSTTATPGAKETFTEAQLERMVRFYPMRRIGVPDDAAGAVAFLVSDDASWVTGQTLGVNGGYAITP